MQQKEKILDIEETVLNAVLHGIKSIDGVRHFSKQNASIRIVERSLPLFLAIVCNVSIALFLRRAHDVIVLLQGRGLFCLSGGRSMDADDI